MLNDTNHLQTSLLHNKALALAVLLALFLAAAPSAWASTCPALIAKYQETPTKHIHLVRKYIKNLNNLKKKMSMLYKHYDILGKKHKDVLDSGKENENDALRNVSLELDAVELKMVEAINDFKNSLNTLISNNKSENTDWARAATTMTREVLKGYREQEKQIADKYDFVKGRDLLRVLHEIGKSRPDF